MSTYLTGTLALVISMLVLTSSCASGAVSPRLSGSLDVLPSGELRLDVNVVCTRPNADRAQEMRVACLKRYQQELGGIQFEQDALEASCQSAPDADSKACLRASYDRCMSQARQNSYQIVQCPSGKANEEIQRLRAAVAKIVAPWGEEFSLPISEVNKPIAVSWERSTYPRDLADADLLQPLWEIFLPNGGRIIWNPEKRHLAAMRGAIDEAKGTGVVTGGPPAKLEVAASLGAGAPLYHGSTVALRLSVTNSGPGTAYRVSAKTKSGFEPIDGADVWFGRIKPGKTSVKDVEFVLPGKSTASEEVLLIAFDEANGHAPMEVTQHLSIRAAEHPVLDVSCALGGRVNLENPKRPVADSGETMTVACAIKNTGSRPAMNTSVSVSLGNVALEPTLVGKISPGQTTSHDTSVTIPSTAQLDAPRQLLVRVEESSFQAQASWKTTVYAGTPTLCPTKITRQEYKARKAKLAKARDVGALDSDEFNRLHAELVRCLE